MATLAELFAAAVQHHQTGHLSQAAQVYRQILQQQPDHARALNMLGVIACQTGNLSEGISYYQQAIAIAPALIDAYHNLALALQMTGKVDAALQQYRMAIAQQPNHVETHHQLGRLLIQQGQIKEGMAHYQQALAVKPNYAPVMASLGTVLLQLGHLPDAIAYLQQALQTQPDLVPAWQCLGQALQLSGRLDEAATALQRSLTLQPNPAIHYLLGKVLEEQGNIEAAIAQFQSALQLQPNYPEADWQHHLILPVSYDTPDQRAYHRQRFCRSLNQLIHQADLTTSAGQQAALQGLGSRTNFYLAYQGWNDRGLQQKYGHFVHQIMTANYPQWSELPTSSSLSPASPSPTPSPKLRIGYLSAHLMAHSAAAWARGWIREHDRHQLEIYCYHIGQHTDFITKEFHDLSDHFRHVPGDLAQIAQQVRVDQLDILIFTDIGMDARTTQLAGLRLAPIQCTAWGHPVTSGLPTIDYYLSSDLMEPENAQQHYSEQLVRLPNIGICYSKPPLPDVRYSRTQFGLREDAIVFLSFQAPYKYLPQYDEVFAQIAYRLMQFNLMAQFVFLRPASNYGVERWQRRLQSAFATVGLESQNHCVLLPKLDRPVYWSLNLVSDVFLDTIYWSGGNSTLEAVAYGLPVVTLPGEFMRGRHSAAILQRLGVTETIATDLTDYINLAVRLGTSLTWRQEITTKIQAGHDRLYDDRECVRALEAFFQQVAQR
ncbi:tetratricopeptide repeat protein [Pantanalinema sp. GBBB05]|uniref:tetratricopeptide repeat protein n=1 Tax=Pantanalinema sp. GBBB05 TaxID=2604139 RepID=UPI001D449F9C|nr:tetratricopeptide repeat protein [Pantanalinema sp. GBBB05]